MVTENFDSFFDDLTNDTPFLKIALEGFSGTGKTFLASKLAIGLHARIKSKKPIVVYDTERAFRAIRDLFETEGISVKVRKSRSLIDLSKSFDACESGYSDIIIVDSITHVWQEFTKSYLEDKSKRLKRKITKLTFPDWGYLKPKWKQMFSDRVVNGKLHVIFTGRAGYDYDHEEDEETGKMTELRKTGIKMKAESETAYEPDVLVLMERQEDLLGKKKEVYRTATVLKDRYRIIDGKTFKNPTYNDFKKMIDSALDGEFVAAIKQNEDNFSELDSTNKEWQKRRDVALEEIENIFPALGLGMSVEDKQIKVDLLDKALNTTSWTKTKSLPVDRLEFALSEMKKFKELWIEYLERCASSGEKVDKKMSYEFMDQIFATPM